MRVEHGGREYEMPDTATDDQVLEFLGNLGVAEVEAGGPAVDMGRQNELLSAEDVDALFTVGEGEQMSEVTLMKLNAEQQSFADKIRQIETGGLKNPFIRTKAAGTGSSAYGPYQITRGLLTAQLKANPNLFDPTETAVIKDLINRQSIALAVGGSDRGKYLPGGSKQAQGAAWAKQYGFANVTDFVNAFDYGGDFGLSGNADFQITYEAVAAKLLAAQLDETGGDALEAASRWHGGKGWRNAASRAHTDVYRKRFTALS